MAPKNVVALQFNRPEGRSEFERSRNAVKDTLADDGAEEAAGHVLEVGAMLDSGVARLKRDLLGSSLCWNEDNQLVTAWIHQQHRRVAEIGLKVADELRGDRSAAELLPRVAAAAFHHWGEALKWTAGRERQDWQPLHALIDPLMELGALRDPINWIADGRGRAVTLESLYFRALLLDRFASGNLTRQQIEVLDEWLWEWAPHLKGTAHAAEGPALRVDLDSSAGLRDGAGDGGHSIYLALAPLEAARRDIIRQLQRGKIIPPHGCTAEFRIEEHVAVLDYLRRVFNATEDTAANRAERQQEAGVRIEVWVGLAEILDSGAGVKAGTETGRWRALSLADPSISTDLRDQGKPVEYRNADPCKRYLWLTDTSATGCGFEALETDANGIQVGDLLGWKRTGTGPILLGRVIRRLASTTAGQVFLGVQLLTATGIPFGLARAHAFDRGCAEDIFLYVPGNDESGRRDAFLLSESVYQQQHAYHARLGDDAFTIRFNRIRAKGRNWVLAGFEIVPARKVEIVPTPAEDANALPKFELALEPDSRFDDPWGNEVSPRLLS